MIKYIFLSLALAWFCITAPTDHGIRFDKRDGALPTLTLPYGTWQATKFDPNGDVSFNSMFTLKVDVYFADFLADIYLQKHSLWGASGRGTKMGEACSPCPRNHHTGWFIWPNMHPVGHKNGVHWEYFSALNFGNIRRFFIPPVISKRRPL